MQVSGAQHRSVVHNVVLYPQSGEQRWIHKPTQTDKTGFITATADTGGKNIDLLYSGYNC